MNMKFDKQVFAQLLKRAIGSRQQKDFAALIKLSPAHLSRMINQKYETPPSVETLQKIASHAENGVTYHELLSICGYIGTQDDLYTLPQSSVPASPFMTATILSGLDQLKIPWTSESDSSTCHSDLTIALQNETSSRWYFKFLSQPEELIQKQFNGNYLELLFLNLRPEDKYSFVTNSPQEYALYRKHLPVNLNLNLSILLIDEMHLQIQEEAWLCQRTPKVPAICKIQFQKS